MRGEQFPGPVVEWLLGRILSVARRDEIIGDLIEDARTRILPRRGATAARAWLLFEALRSVRHLVWPSSVRSRWSGGDRFVQDVRFAFRTLRRRPLFALAALSALAFGIGATTTVFSIAEVTLLRRLPCFEPDRILSVSTERLTSGGQWFRWGVSLPEFQDVREADAAFGTTAMWNVATQTLRGMGYPEDIIRGGASDRLPEVLGIRPILGRWFRLEEVGPDFVPVVVLGYSFWVERLGADPNVVGRTLNLNDTPYTIIGVVPQDFRIQHELYRSDSRSLLSPRTSGEYPFWVPLAHNYGGADAFSQRNQANWELLVRLDPGVTKEQAQEIIASRIGGENAADEIRVRGATLAEQEVAGLPAQLFLLGIPAMLLLLIACGNVATLLVGEGVHRGREITTRFALGAGTRRIARQLLTESVLLGLCGSALGAAVAWLSTRVLAAYAPAGSVIGTLEVSLPVLAFASTAGVLAGLVFGLAPLLAILRAPPGAITDPGRGSRTARARRALDVVVGFEVALTIVLLVGAGLFGRTLANLFSVDLGFDAANLIALPTAIDRDSYPERGPVNYEIIQRLREIPGVESASGGFTMPLVTGRAGDGIEVEGREPAPDEGLPVVLVNQVMPGFLATMGIRLVEGREFSAADAPGAPPVAIVSASTAQRLWPDESALGKRFRLRRDTAWSTVVGVAGDMLYGSLGAEASSPVYRPYLQRPNWNGIRLAFTVRTTMDPVDIVPRLEAAARSVEPEILINPARVMSTVVSDSATDQRYRALMLVGFAVAAVILVVVGIFGVAARAIALRMKELAIRLALGEASSALKWRVLRGSLGTAGVGVAGGLLVAYSASRVLSSFLFGVESSDPLTYAVAVALVLILLAVASYLPSRRLARMDPARILTEE